MSAGAELGAGPLKPPGREVGELLGAVVRVLSPLSWRWWWAG
jgi:hypothetical protein